VKDDAMTDPNDPQTGLVFTEDGLVMRLTVCRACGTLVEEDLTDRHEANHRHSTAVVSILSNVATALHALATALHALAIGQHVQTAAASPGAAAPPAAVPLTTPPPATDPTAVAETSSTRRSR
jgi:hypothetical protein